MIRTSGATADGVPDERRRPWPASEDPGSRRHVRGPRGTTVLMVLACCPLVHASRACPTCASLRADLGQARDRCLVPLAQERSLHSPGTRALRSETIARAPAVRPAASVARL